MPGHMPNLHKYLTKYLPLYATLYYVSLFSSPINTTLLPYSIGLLGELAALFVIGRALRQKKGEQRLPWVLFFLGLFLYFLADILLMLFSSPYHFLSSLHLNLYEEILYLLTTVCFFSATLCYLHCEKYEASGMIVGK